MSLSDLRGAHSFVKGNLISAEGVSERELTCVLALGTGWGHRRQGSEGARSSASFPGPLQLPELGTCLWKALQWGSLTQSRSISTSLTPSPAAQ